MEDKAKRYREELVNNIKSMAKDLDEMAEDLVGTSEFITEFEIRLSFPQGSVGIPTIQLIREYLPRNVLEAMQTNKGGLV